MSKNIRLSFHSVVHIIPQLKYKRTVTVFVW